MNLKTKFSSWYGSGSPWVWINATAISLCLIVVFGVAGLIAYEGLAHFWPKSIAQLNIEKNGIASKLWGRQVLTESVAAQDVQVMYPEVAKLGEQKAVAVIQRRLIQVANRDYLGEDFSWHFDLYIKQQTFPKDVYFVERIEWGPLIGKLLEVRSKQGLSFKQALNRVNRLREKIAEIEKSQITRFNYQLENLRLSQRKAVLNKQLSDALRQQYLAKEKAINIEFEVVQLKLNGLYADTERDSAIFVLANGREVEVSVGQIIDYHLPNQLNLIEKFGHFFHSFALFLSSDPREANTEGGIFPAMFGTLLMVMLMAVLVTPFGVIAAVYLREYAKQGLLTRCIRIAVNNLAGVPSIVYGVFGLGFFVYFVGGNIDQLFYPEALPAPTFGTPGLFWSALTLALLTVPVVIVSTEEGLTRVPKALKEGSLALGATKLETLYKVILPMTSPSIITGLILAVARAAGEVAPLMLVGVVKLAPQLPFDGNFPFLHMDRKFMHLGFHIYDVGFQSPNIEASRPLVYATSLVLLLLVIALNLGAMLLRNRLTQRYRMVGN